MVVYQVYLNNKISKNIYSIDQSWMIFYPLEIRKNNIQSIFLSAIRTKFVNILW